MFEKHARKGRLVYIDGKLQTRRWSKPGDDGDRFSTEILLVPGGQGPVPRQAERRRTGTARVDARDGQAPVNDSAMPAGGTPAPSDMDDDIPF